MDSTFPYSRERRHFGRQCILSDKNELLVSIPPNKQLAKEYILRDEVHRSTQRSKTMGYAEVNTKASTYDHHSVMHTEGGWPKDINQDDPEQTTRFRRKIEKDEIFITQLMAMTTLMEGCIFQNNAVNIYENYFADLDPPPLIEPSYSRTISVYRDASGQNRPITHLAWSPDGATKLAVSHAPSKNHETVQALGCNDSYIWELDNPNAPLMSLHTPSSAICLEYNPKEISTLVAGTQRGQVLIWDTRVSGDAVAISEREVCHRESVNSVNWINSKTGTEFFSGSSDGQVIWWDIRKINEPMDRLLIDPVKTDDQVLSRCYGISRLEYESTMPTKFMVGTDMGYVFSCNRKGKTPSEKIAVKMKCHLGPVFTIMRNPSFLKNFLTVGDWTARIWSEDCRESSIIWTKNQPAMLTAGAWSVTKCSTFFTCRMDGVLDAWDLLQQHNDPVLSMKVCDEPLICLRPHETGRFLSASNNNGATYLVEVSDNMAISLKNDKPLLTAMFERENKREKILEAKMREIKLRVKTAQQARSSGDDSKNVASVAELACEQSEQEFWASVAMERSKSLVNVDPDEFEEGDKTVPDNEKPSIHVPEAE